MSFISAEAEFTPKTVQTEQERVKLVYRIKIDIENRNMELKPGMPADAEIIADRSCGSKKERIYVANVTASRRWRRRATTIATNRHDARNK